VILYADDILLITPSICTLEKLLRICERELNAIDMAINARKSCCVRIGPKIVVVVALLTLQMVLSFHGQMS